MNDSTLYISPEMFIWECEINAPIAASVDGGDQIPPYQSDDWHEE